MDEIVVLNLFGEEFRFKPDEQVENPEHVAKYLENYIAEAEKRFPGKASGKNKLVILLLAAMNLSKDYHELKQQHASLEKETDQRISSLLEKIDKEIESNRKHLL